MAAKEFPTLCVLCGSLATSALKAFYSFSCLGASGPAPVHQRVPALGLHELGPAPIEVPEIVLARLRVREVANRPQNAKALPLVILDLGPQPLLVAVGIAASDRAA